MRGDHLFEYQLAYHARLDWTDLERAEAYKSLAECGTWSEEMWWHPNVNAVGGDSDFDIDRAAKRTAQNAGFRIAHRRVAEDHEFPEVAK